MEQRLRILILEALRGILHNLRWASKKSSSLVFGSFKIFFSSAFLAAYFSTKRLRFKLRCMDDFFAIFLFLSGYLAACSAADFLNGIPKSLSNSLPDLSSVAVVTIVMSMPMFFLPGSTVTSGKIVWSAMP